MARMMTTTVRMKIYQGEEDEIRVWRHSLRHHVDDVDNVYIEHDVLVY